MANDTLTAYGPAFLPTVTATLYTVPASKAHRIVELRVVNVSAVTAHFTISKGTDAAGTRLWNNISLAAGQVYKDAGPVLTAAQFLQGSSDTASACIYHISLAEVVA